MAALAECAAVAVEPSHGGPSRLVIFVVDAQPLIQNRRGTVHSMGSHHCHVLTYQFDIKVVVLPELPRTASNKIMRRVLRNEYKPRAEENGGE